MNAADFEALVARVTYKPGYTFSVRLRDPLRALVRAWPSDLLLAIGYTAQDSGNPERRVFIENREPVPPYVDAYDEAAALDWLRGHVHRVEAHEADEWLRVDGAARWHPHKETSGMT